MRYFVQLSYRGTAYCGWQKQPGVPSVQQIIEQSLGTILRTTVEIVGCGRTDSGVHALEFYFHFDHTGPLPDKLLYRLNTILPGDIAARRILEVAPEAHARYDATLRRYEYRLIRKKDPFANDTAFLFSFARSLNFQKMQAAAGLLLHYESFYPFCKSNTDVKTMNCRLFQSEWIEGNKPEQWLFQISADRFLRGMVRLIVGMCINVGLGKTSLQEVEQAMQQQHRLKRSYSVPAQGLFLTAVKYPFLAAK